MGGVEEETERRVLAFGLPVRCIRGVGSPAPTPPRKAGMPSGYGAVGARPEHGGARSGQRG